MVIDSHVALSIINKDENSPVRDISASLDLMTDISV